MFRVVVIDDEPLILRSIKNAIEETDQSFKVVGTATDGEHGLKIIESINPDVVFVDICMPVMSGLEMVEKLRDINPDIGVVILSGYQEFDYAKKAISLHVIEYLVKPLNPLTLQESLNQVREKLESKLQSEKKNLLEKLIHYTNFSKENTKIFSEQTRFLIVKICFGAFNFFRRNQFAQEPALDGMTILRESCERMFLGESGYWLLNCKYDNEKVLVFETSLKIRYEKILQIFEELKLQLYPKYYVTFVISKEEKKLEEIASEVTKLDSVLYHRSIFGQSNSYWVDEEESKKEARKILLEHSEKIKFLVDQNKRKELSELIKEIFNECEKNESTQSDLIDILKGITRICCSSEAKYDIDFLTNATLLNSYTYKTLYKKFMEVISEFSNSKDNSMDELGTEYMVYKVQDYLDLHFSEKILIQNVADKFGFSYSYLCHLFRRYKNISPNEYIIAKRMEKAKNLLDKEKDLSIKKISRMVGYEDQYYFSRIFKMNVGVTPSDFRKRE